MERQIAIGTGTGIGIGTGIGGRSGSKRVHRLARGTTGGR